MQFENGTVVRGRITKVAAFGAFVSIEGGGVGMVHISEISNSYVKDIKDFLSDGQEIEAMVISCDENMRYGLSIRRVPKKVPDSSPADYFEKPASKEQTFDEMMHRFKQVSDEKMCDLKRGYDNKRGKSGKKHK